MTATHNAAESASTPASEEEVEKAIAELTALFVKSLRGLAQAGQPVMASQIAGKAWWTLQDYWPREAERINGTMHYLARLEDEQAAQETSASSPPH